MQQSQEQGTKSAFGPQGVALDAQAPEKLPEPTPPVPRRQAIAGLRRQLSDEDLRSPAVHKMLLDDLEVAEREVETLRPYIDRYHEADKRVGILEEKFKSLIAIDIGFAVGVGVGCAFLGLIPSVPATLQTACGVAGFVLIAGGIAMKAVKIK